MWYKIIGIIDWFGEIKERYQLVRNFNKAAQSAFIAGATPTLLESKITKGDSSYRHSFSKFLGGGFRIKALSGRPLDKSEMIEIGRIVLDNEQLVRKLITLGWDTLEIHDNKGFNGCKWPLKDFANLSGYIR